MRLVDINENNIKEMDLNELSLALHGTGDEYIWKLIAMEAISRLYEARTEGRKWEE